jgi:peptidoglycan/LPS O-acetylase OafA/YrhL
MGFSSLQSGFLGVDVFFVISGFLMAVLYDRNNKADFYRRRAKRLLPAYYIIILVTLIFSFFMTTANETVQVINQVKYATFFSSNIGFWTQNSYFSKTEFNPLLHLWSLGVEIQFYLIVPLISWVLIKHKSIYLILFSISLALCFIIVGISPKTSFFMMPLRLWEFLIGYGAAYYFTNKGALKFTKFKWVGLFGLVALCIIPFLSVDGEALSAIDGHPGLFALLVSIATGSVLVFGIPNVIEKSILARLLDRVGGYSYSIYLVHFPIIVLYLSSPFSGTSLNIRTLQDGLMISVLIFISTMLLHHFVELKKFSVSVKNLILISSTSLIVLTLSLPLIQNEFSTENENLIFGAFSDRSTYRCGKLIRVLDPKAISCDLTTDIQTPNQKIMLVGNSHADSIKTSFVTQTEEKQAKLFFTVPNNPLMKGGLSAEKIVNDAIKKDIDKLVLHFSASAISIKTIKNIAGLSKLAGIKVYFIEPVPTWEKHIPKVMYQSLTSNEDILPNKTRADYLAKNDNLLKFVRTIKDENFNNYPIVSYFCNPKCEYSSEEGKPLYFDNGHLTLTGSARLNEIFNLIILEN